jgi:nucleoredoxin
MPGIADALGDVVIEHSGESVPVSRFTKAGTVVGLYFSSAFCPERAFTPFLAGFYCEFRKTDAGQHFEVVYVSADKEKENFDQYFDEMPFHAVPFDDVQRRSQLWRKFKVRFTPTLILLDGPTGNVITTNGRDCLSDDIEGKYFPWPSPSLDDILSGQLLRGSDLVDCKAALDGKVKGFYFSAHWCPPCRAFTPQLAAVYEKLVASGKNFEVVFVTSDRSQSSFDEYLSSMPGWLAVPYKDKRAIDLTRHFAVEGIPSLVVVDENNKVICHNARFIITSDPEGKEFPWLPEPVQELTESSSLTLHESAALIYFTDGDVDLIEQAKLMLTELYTSYTAEWNSTKDTLDEIPELRFYYEGIQSDEIADTLRSFAQLDNRKPLVAILDAADQRVYSLPEHITDVTRVDIDSLITEFKNGAGHFGLFPEFPE